MFFMRNVTKVLVNRIKDYLPNLISEHQSAFVTNRIISHNILLANIKQKKEDWKVICL